MGAYRFCVALFSFNSSHNCKGQVVIWNKWCLNRVHSCFNKLNGRTPIHVMGLQLCWKMDMLVFVDEYCVLMFLRDNRFHFAIISYHLMLAVLMWLSLAFFIFGPNSSTYRLWNKIEHIFLFWLGELEFSSNLQADQIMYKWIKACPYVMQQTKVSPLLRRRLKGSENIVHNHKNKALGQHQSYY